MKRLQNAVRGVSLAKGSSTASTNARKRLHKFSLGLNPSIRAVISQILNMNTLLSVDTMYNMIIHKERHVVIAWNQDAVAFAARVLDKSGLVCNVCHKASHSSLDCF